MAKKSPANPFYVLLVIVGIAFSVSACAYGVMAFRAVRSEPDTPQGALLTFLDRHGATLMGGELVLLALFTVAAIALDHSRERRAKASLVDSDRIV